LESTGTHSRWASPRTQRRLLWLSGVILAAGIAAVLIVFRRNTGKSVQAPFSNEPAQIVKKQKELPLSREARRVAGRFILTAVQRKNLGEAWSLAGPNVRGGLTKKQWETGNIPVVPFLDKIGAAPIKVDSSTQDHALLEIALVAKNKSVKPAYFFVDLARIGKGKNSHWVVDGWVPAYGRPDIPANPNN
jgi:hypothetical protein